MLSLSAADLRALLDVERYAASLKSGPPNSRDWSALLAGNPVAQKAFRELMMIFHCPDVVDEAHPQHAWVRPPLR